MAKDLRGRRPSHVDGGVWRMGTGITEEGIVQ